MSIEWNVRPARPGDLDSVIELESVCFDDPWTPESLLAEITPHPRRRPLVVEIDGRVRAVALVWVVADEMHLVSLGVHPEHRRQGVATAMLGAMVEMARDLGSLLITLEVREHNAGALSFYRRHGFVEVARRKGYYPDTREDALVLLRPLDEGPAPDSRGMAPH